MKEKSTNELDRKYYIKILNKVSTVAMIKSISELLQIYSSGRNEYKLFDMQRNELNFRNGIFDLKTWKLRKRTTKVV